MDASAAASDSVFSRLRRLGENARAHGTLLETAEQANAGAAAHGAQDDEDLLGLVGIGEQAANRLDGLKRAEPSVGNGLGEH